MCSERLWRALQGTRGKYVAVSGKFGVRKNHKVGLFVSSGHPLFLEGMRMILRDDPGIRLVGEARQLTGTMEKVRRLRPQVLILDLPLPEPGRKGIRVLDAISRMKAADANLKIFVLTISGKLKSVAQYRKAGASGFILPATPLDQLLHRILGSSKSGSEENAGAGSVVGESGRRKPRSLRPRILRFRRRRNG
jgi:DNA-binding NarL/FixJ family response regulator